MCPLHLNLKGWMTPELKSAMAPGIHIQSHLVIPDDYNLTRTIKISPKVILWTSKVLLNYKIYSKILAWFYHVHYACVLIISYPLKSWWIMEYNKHLCLQWNHKFGDSFDGTVFSIKRSIFMLLTIDIFHFVKNCIHRLIVRLSKKVLHRI